MIAPPFFKQAELLLRVLPHALSQPEFALKGGTAINLFVRNVPRLSVDIDLTYLPVEERELSLNRMSICLQNIAGKISTLLPGSRVLPKFEEVTRRVLSLFVQHDEAAIKIEPNPVFRGAVFPCELREISPGVASILGVETFISLRTLSLADLYGSKICATLDRQHPRDLFDIKILLDHEGITDSIRRAFVVYLAGHNRPMNELLEPTRLSMKGTFENEFQGMTVEPITYKALIAVREKLITLLKRTLSENEKMFLLSLKRGEPEWQLLEIEGISQLPALQWKLKNIKQMERQKHSAAIEKLKKVLEC